MITVLCPLSPLFKASIIQHVWGSRSSFLEEFTASTFYLWLVPSYIHLTISKYRLYSNFSLFSPEQQVNCGTSWSRVNNGNSVNIFPSLIDWHCAGRKVKISTALIIGYHMTKLKWCVYSITLIKTRLWKKLSVYLETVLQSRGITRNQYCEMQ